MQYRMYCLCERHLSIAQKTIQAAHAIVEYSLKYGDTEEYKRWAEYDKTIIVLDGGTTQDMIEDIQKLSEIRHNYEIFAEPDMGKFVTSIAFLVDDRVFDYETYGKNFEHFRETEFKRKTPSMVNTDSYAVPEVMISAVLGTISQATYEKWLEKIGGQSQEVLKSIVSEKRIAQ